MIFRANFFEIFDTVIVSCASALFLFWVNIVVFFKYFFNFFRFRFFSRVFLPKNQRGSEKVVKNNLRHRFSSSLPNLNPASKAAGRKPYTEIYSSSVEEPISMEKNVIAQSISIEQLSEKVVCFGYCIESLFSIEMKYN